MPATKKKSATKKGTASKPKKSRSERPSPSAKASETPLGTRSRGNDGQLWEVCEYTMMGNVHQRWEHVDKPSKHVASPKKASPKVAMPQRASPKKASSKVAVPKRASPKKVQRASPQSSHMSVSHRDIVCEGGFCRLVPSKVSKVAASPRSKKPDFKRKGPSEHAADAPLGAEATGNDGLDYVCRQDKHGRHYWAKIKDSA